MCIIKQRNEDVLYCEICGHKTINYIEESCYDAKTGNHIIYNNKKCGNTKKLLFIFKKCGYKYSNNNYTQYPIGY